MYCNTCGSRNPDTAAFCSNCGNQLPQAALTPKPAQAQFSGQSPHVGAPFDDEAYLSLIGEKKAAYYLPRFKAFHHGASSISWNWPSFFVTFFWLLHRRMWKVALLYWVASYALGVLIGAIGGALGSSGGAFLLIAFAVAFYILPPTFANVIYYRHCTKTIQRSGSTTQSRAEQIGYLKGHGGTGGAGLIVASVFVLISVIGILAAVALPAYQDYTVRAKVAEALLVGRAASAKVEAYYLANGQLPETLARAGYTVIPSSYVRDMAVNPENGIISVTLLLTGESPSHLLLIPSQAPDKTISWACRSQDIANKYLPGICKSQP